MRRELFFNALVSLFLAATTAAQKTHMSGNFPRDLLGPIDTRDTRPDACAGGPCVWGRADYDVLPIKFHPPAGYRVLVTKLRGDVVSWIKSLPGDPPTPLEGTAGVLGAIYRTNMDWSLCDYCAVGVPVYVQDAVTEKQPKSVRSFEYDDVDLLLGPDNVLNVKIASWLNTTGKPIHIEFTYTVYFEFVLNDGSQFEMTHADSLREAPIHR